MTHFPFWRILLALVCSSERLHILIPSLRLHTSSPSLSSFDHDRSRIHGWLPVTTRVTSSSGLLPRLWHRAWLTNSAVIACLLRYDATISPSTSIKFITDSVLLAELALEFLLSKHSVLIMDEAHEWSMSIDILFGALSRNMKLCESV